MVSLLSALLRAVSSFSLSSLLTRSSDHRRTQRNWRGLPLHWGVYNDWRRETGFLNEIWDVREIDWEKMNITMVDSPKCMDNAPPEGCWIGRQRSEQRQDSTDKKDFAKVREIAWEGYKKEDICDRLLFCISFTRNFSRNFSHLGNTALTSSTLATKDGCNSSTYVWLGIKKQVSRLSLHVCDKGIILGITSEYCPCRRQRN